MMQTLQVMKIRKKGNIASVLPNLPQKETDRIAQQLILPGAVPQEAKTVSPAEAQIIFPELLLVLKVSLLDLIIGELKLKQTVAMKIPHMEQQQLILSAAFKALNGQV